MHLEFVKTRSRAPLRLGLAGGGTDLSAYCNRFGGAVLNVTMDRYAFASFIPRTDDQVVFEADDMGVVENHDIRLGSSDLVLHRAVYDRMMRDFNDGKRIPMTVRTTVDAPPGSGLGSSSALVVALVDGFRAILGAPLGDYDVAHLAYEIEREDAGLSGGRQDHYAAAFGGINFIEFNPNDQVVVNPIRLARDDLNELECSLVVGFSGRSRKSAHIIDQQTTALTGDDAAALEAMHKLKADAIAMKGVLLQGDIEGMARILSESWIAKKATASAVSNDELEKLMHIAHENGALGGKVSGAGGGGFMFFLVHPENRFRLIEKLTASGCHSSRVKLTFEGSETWRY